MKQASGTFATADSLLFTSESVTEGHPDKVCDQISDAVLDAILANDPDARVACETATTTGLIHSFERAISGRGWPAAAAASSVRWADSGM